MPGGKLFWFPRGGIDRAGGKLEDVPEGEGDEGAVEDIAVTRQGWKRRACQRDRVGKGTRKRPRSCEIQNTTLTTRAYMSDGAVCVRRDLCSC